jgi:hypothetical protein
LNDVERYGITSLVYGPKGAGKSWLLDTMPPPRLIMDAEAGSRFTPSRKITWDPLSEKPPEPNDAWSTARVVIRDFRTAQKTLEWLISGQHPFRSLGCDSASEMQQRAVDEMAGTRQMKTDEWGQLLRVMSDFTRKSRDLVSHPTNPLDAVIFVAMARQRDGQWEPHLQGQLATIIPYYFDLVSYIAPVINPEDNRVIRRLFCGTFPGYLTGERVGGCLGEYIDNPNVTSMLETVRQRISE